MTFNLLLNPFLPAELLNGEQASFGVLDLLRNAHLIKRLATISPLDDFAIHRLLLVLLHEAAPGESLGQSAIGSHILDAIERKTNLFDLFDKDRPFFQDPSAREEQARPASDLFAELPSDTSINHYRHVYDASVALCPSCCAVGLLRIPPFCTQGGQGKAPSLNAAPPVYAMPVGRTLLETLALNLAALSTVAGDRPCWSGNSESKQMGPLEGFTWQARRVLLFPIPAEGRKCTRCGGQEAGADPRIVHQIIFAKGRTLAEVAGRGWRDPHVAFLEGSALRFPEKPLAAAGEVLKIARSLLHSLGSTAGDSGVDAVRRAAAMLNGQPLLVTSICFATRQAKPLDDFAMSWQLAGDLKAETAEKILRELDWYEKKVGDIQKKEGARLKKERPARTGDALKAPARTSEMHCHREAAALLVRLLADPTHIDKWRDEVYRAIHEGFQDWLVPRTPLLLRTEMQQQFDQAYSYEKGAPAVAPGEAELEAERKFIRTLSRLRQDAKDRLKRLATQPLQEDGRTFDIYTDLWWPRHGRVGSRLVVMTVATLYPWWTSRQRGYLDFGMAARALARKRGQSGASVRRQFEDVLAAPLALVGTKMLPLIRDMDRLKIGLGWAELLSDLSSWMYSEQSTQRRWAHSFLTGNYHADRDSSAPESLAVESES